MSERRRLIAGCMTGTSLDGLDAALVEVVGTGLAMRATVLGCESVAMAKALRATLMRIAEGEAVRAAEVVRAARGLGELHADVVGSLIRGTRRFARKASLSVGVEGGGGGLHLVVAHGQTVCHLPGEGGGGVSWQLLDPWPIVRRHGVAVVHDLRGADLIAGGQGAPITPLADWVLFGRLCGEYQRVVVVNLGGICNVTVLSGERVEDIGDIQAADVGPCNLLLDGVAARVLGERYDDGGRAALAGRYHPFAAEYVGEYVAGGGTLGREQYGDAAVEGLLREAGWAPEGGLPDALLAEARSASAWERGEGLSKEDVLACVAGAVAGRIVGGVAGLLGGMPTEVGTAGRRVLVVLAGGGVRNLAVVRAIREGVEAGDGRVVVSDEVGLPHEAREAAGMAVLGALAEDGVPITLESVTGGDRPGRAGRWAYP